MNVVSPLYLNASEIKSFKVRRVIKGNFGQTILREVLVEQWGLVPERGAYLLPRGWSFVGATRGEGKISYHICDKDGNRRGKMSFCRYEGDGTLQGLITVYHRYAINKSASGRGFFYIMDQNRSKPSGNVMHNVNETVLRDWLETNYPDYKDPFAYWV